MLSLFDDVSQVAQISVDAIFVLRRSILGRGGLLARSLSGVTPRVAGGSLLLEGRFVRFWNSGVLAVPLSSRSTTFKSELWTCKVSPKS